MIEIIIKLQFEVERRLKIKNGLLLIFEKKALSYSTQFLV